MPDPDLDRAAAGLFPGDTNRREQALLLLLRKLDPKVFIQNLAEEIEAHGLNPRLLRFLEDTAMHAADEMAPTEKDTIEEDGSCP
jgi:hypothetical protein